MSNVRALMLLIAAVFYLLIVSLGVFLLWLAFQVSVRARLSFIRGNDRKPLPNADLISGNFSAMAVTAGVATLLLAAAIPALGLRLGTWHIYLAFIAGIIGVWRQLLFMSYHRKRKSLNQDVK
jgi:sterol desaturase/sphingolipid hydroxylase (fatty acid hydroxylase superfamily)